MRARSPRKKKVKGPKRVPYELIAPDSVIGRPIYRLLKDLVKSQHDEIDGARIALAWNLAWRADADGRVTLGRCKVASALDRELAAFDFVILLRKAFWIEQTVTDEMRRALLDHELCHATVKYDDRTGDPVTDERGRFVYRIRKHDIEEFTEIVTRHGVWKKDLEAFAKALFSNVGDFKPCEQCRDSPGWAAQVDSAGARVQRCPCWIAWRDRAMESRNIQEGPRATV